ncbi:MAG TPA: dihydroorotase [Chitinophagaceae bacterium]|nr:dihydroorotase [Chitinophagaceae bacterium]
MKFLLKQVLITDPHSPYHRSRKDILIVDGTIDTIADNILSEADQTLALEGLSVSPGWADVFANFADPGYEHKETLQTGAAAAAAGGFTSVFVVPNTRPVIDAKSQVEYIVQQSKQLPVQIIPLGAITKNAAGKELAEMYDMNNSGAIAFSDGLQPIQAAGILLKALQYTRAFNGVLVQVPDDTSIAPHGLINEGLVSTRLGLPGKPMMAEELMVARDIKLARYADAKLHFTGVSSPKSLEYIKRAKAGGIKITCSVTPYHMVFCDEDLYSYDTNLKVNPPLRTREDMMLLREAVADGTVDCIASHHMPQDWDNKTCEFEYAKNGMIGLQTCYSVVKKALPAVSEERWVELLSLRPRQIFGLPLPQVKEKEIANLTLFQPTAQYVFRKEDIKSRSFNSPFIGTAFTGRVSGIVNASTLLLNNW